MRALLRVLAYPLVLGGGVGGAWLALRAGHPSELVVAVASVAVALCVFLLEKVIPYRAEWARSKGDLGYDVVYTVTTGVASELGRLAVVALLGVLATALARETWSGPWPHGWPFLLQLLLAVVLGDLGVYAIHRWQHEKGGWLWRLHAPHHSSPRLYWLNVNRNHPLDAFLSGVLFLAPALLLGAGPEAMALVGVLALGHSFFQHCNADLRFGPFNWLISGPEVHRWHHSRELGEANANYGQFVLVWDLLFGTRRVPRDREPPVDVGLHGMPGYPTGFWGQLVSPFSRG